MVTRTLAKSLVFKLLRADPRLKKKLAVLVALLFVTPFLVVPAKSQPESFGVLWESTRQVVNVIEWGSIEVGESKTINLYVENYDTDETLTSVIVKAENFDPVQASNFIELSGSRAVNLNEKEGCVVPLTCSIDPTAKDVYDFSFDVTLVAGFSSTEFLKDSSYSGNPNSWGGAGSRVIDREESYTLPSKEPLTNFNIAWVFVLGLVVYLLFRGKGR